jgi:DNA-directed RNA polymerase subunit K/omega
MSNIKKKAQGIEPNIEARDIHAVTAKTHNIYESLAIISRRANQIGTELKQELHAKLEEFASGTDNLEEVHENKEQIEISRFYERLPNPALIAFSEYMKENVYSRYTEIEAKSEEDAAV